MRNLYFLLHSTLVLLASFPVNSATAQETTVSGKVVSLENGNALPGVNVLIKGTNSGTVTDVNGNYSLQIPENTILVYSFIGYTPQEIEVAGKTVIDVTMSENIKSLSEVVVVGYGTQEKTAVTGSVASIDFEKFKDRSFSNVMQSLSGQLAGVNITQAQGAPGSAPIVRIRGISSITAGTEPLYVVDGLPLEDFNLNLINPQDIASVEVLKDASSAAIYGSRGANGVVLITTKLGKPGETVVNLSYEHGIQEVTRKVDLMNAQQFVEYYIDAHNNAWIAAGGNASDPNSARPKQYRIPPDFVNNPKIFGNGTDWQDVAFRTAPSHDIQLSVSGGTEKTQFLFSGSYLDQEAVLDNNYYKRLSVRSNIKHALSDKVNIGLNLSLSAIYDRTNGTEGKSDVVSLAIQSDPIFPLYNENGNLGFKDPNSEWYRFAEYNDLQLWHVYSLTREIQEKNKAFNTLANAFLEYEIIDGLTFRSSLSGNLINTRYDDYRNEGQKYGYSSYLGAQGRSNSSFMLNWLTENTLNYSRVFGDHSVHFLVGYTAQKQRDELTELTSTGFPNDLVPTLNAGRPSGGMSFASEWSMLSYLARVNYDYQFKYFLTATLRRDGSSRFGTNTKWGYFPSVSVGWLLSEEAFLQNSDWLNTLKLKASYGVTGNNQIPNYGPVSLLSSSNYVYGNTIANGLRVENIANRDLKWEKTSQFNFGVEMGLFKNRLNLSAEVYNSTTRDLLLNVPVPDITGFSTQLTNIGKLRNRGFEFTLSSKNIDKEFKWGTDLNFSLNRNKVLQLGPDNAPIIFTQHVSTVKTEVGQPISNYYGYIFDGVYNTQEQIEGTPHDASTTPGDPIVRDVNGDGNITEEDRTTLGNYQPDFTSGLVNTFSYKGFEFSFMLQGSFGGEILNQQIRYNAIWNGGRNAYAEVANYWRSPENPGDGVHFKPTIEPKGLQEKFSSYWVEDGTFVRIKNIRLSYALPESLLANLPIDAINVYVNAENVYVFSDYLNFDPENTTYSSGLLVGADYGSYPVPRILTFGANFKF